MNERMALLVFALLWTTAACSPVSQTLPDERSQTATAAGIQFEEIGKEYDVVTDIYDVNGKLGYTAVNSGPGGGSHAVYDGKVVGTYNYGSYRDLASLYHGPGKLGESTDEISRFEIKNGINLMVNNKTFILSTEPTNDTRFPGKVKSVVSFGGKKIGRDYTWISALRVSDNNFVLIGHGADGKAYLLYGVSGVVTELALYGVSGVVSELSINYQVDTSHAPIFVGDKIAFIVYDWAAIERREAGQGSKGQKFIVKQI